MLLEGVSVLGVLPGASIAVGSTRVVVDRAVVGASSWIQSLLCSGFGISVRESNSMAYVFKRTLPSKT